MLRSHCEFGAARPETALPTAGKQRILISVQEKFVGFLKTCPPASGSQNMAQIQNTNLIRIDTILNDLDPPTPADEDDPLLLTKVTGSEALSAPFLYEVTMVRSLERDRRIPLDPAKLINTVARIGVGLEAQGPTFGTAPNRWLLRGGVFQSIESLGTATLQRTRHYRVYRATVVPPFAMMQREIAFRIFENLSPADIIKNMLSGFPHLEFADDIMSRCSCPART
jgi:uncharacterized protein involved in type VI secretion and phage assembly